MVEVLDGVAARIKPRIRSLIRVKHLYSLATLLTMYKMQVWSIIEYQTPALMLVCPSQLDRLDKIQRWFLHEVELTDVQAFCVHNVAPPSLRQTIGLLGFLHKVVLGTAHPAIREYFELDDRPPPYPWFHTKCLKDKQDSTQFWPLWRRSLFSYISIYNRLPQSFVDSTSVSEFQSKLTSEAKRRAEGADNSWRKRFSSCEDVLPIAQHGA